MGNVVIWKILPPEIYYKVIIIFLSATVSPPEQLLSSFSLGSIIFVEVAVSVKIQFSTFLALISGRLYISFSRMKTIPIMAVVVVL